VGDTPLWLLGLVAAPGLLAFVLGVYLWTMLGRIRATQRVLLPDGTSASLLDTQSAVQRALRRLEDDVVEVKTGIEERTAVVDEALSRAIRFQGLVRYDAYRDMGGQQSWSIALVDEERNGTIITSLHARDHARVYMKEMRDGRSLQRLSPEEVTAVEAALGESLPGLQPEALPEQAP
jgi:signal transduction histidine kinase